MTVGNGSARGPLVARTRSCVDERDGPRHARAVVDAVVDRGALAPRHCDKQYGSGEHRAVPVAHVVVARALRREPPVRLQGVAVRGGDITRQQVVLLCLLVEPRRNTNEK
jgi:hypothetical protein